MLLLTRSGIRIMSVTVEINAVCAGMRKHTIAQDPDSHGTRIFAEQFKITIAAQNRIDPQIIRCVISMIGTSFKNRV